MYRVRILEALVGSFVRRDTEYGILRMMSVLYLSRPQVPGSSASVPATSPKSATSKSILTLPRFYITITCFPYIE